MSRETHVEHSPAATINQGLSWEHHGQHQMADSFFANSQTSASTEEGRGSGSGVSTVEYAYPGWEAHGSSAFAWQDPGPAVPPAYVGGGGTRSRAPPAPARGKKEPRVIHHIPGISKPKDELKDAWHHKDERKDDRKDESKKVVQHIHGISKLKDELKDAWHHKDDLKDKSKKVVQHIPNMSKLKDELKDAWHHRDERKDDLKDKSKKVMQKVTSLCLGNKDHKKR